MSDIVRLVPRSEGGRLAELVDYREVTLCDHCRNRTFKVSRYRFGDGVMGPWRLECANCERPVGDVKVER